MLRCTNEVGAVLDEVEMVQEVWINDESIDERGYVGTREEVSNGMIKL